MINAILKNLKNKVVKQKINTASREINEHQFTKNIDILKIKRIQNFDKIDEKSFVDIPASIPQVLFPLSKVGVTHRKHKLKIRDIFDEAKIIEPEVDIEIFFDLPAYQRGLHMSRIEKAMQKYQDAELSLKQYAENFIKYAAELQNRESGEVKIEFNYEKLVNKNSSGRTAHEIIKILFFGFLKNGKVKYKLGLEVPFMNACPCPQRWSIREAYHHLKNLGFSDNEIYNIISTLNFGTHTNLGTAKLIIEDLNNNLNYNEFYEILDRSVLIARELLSGRDEFEFIKASLIREQFCEDVARDIVKNLIEMLDKKLNPDSLIEIEVEVNESIHFHNLKVEIREKLGEIKKVLKYNN